ncbi:hypothetical protein BDZ45DRAFT_307062 [Acephala macrosclerotiorum]|nr:hypothetical protein BDZ45DRAFT_307062 [Acephala macrosclerotiorum]
MAYSGRTGPNVSEYIANLNAIPSASDLPTEDDFNLDADLAMFTNTQFFDYDLGTDTDIQHTGQGVDGQDGQTVAPDNVDLNSLEFMNDDFSFPDFNTFPQAPSFDNAPPPQLAPINTSQPLYPASSSAGSPAPAPPSSAGTRRKADSVSSPQNIEDASRVAAEEDKRRRNTAASARFRVKKKQREQALERSAKEMSDKVSALEGRINQLETENKWLKNLITEKNESKDDLAALWKKYSAETEARKGSGRTDGVGTDA